jgi:hypothetical protein
MMEIPRIENHEIMHGQNVMKNTLLRLFYRKIEKTIGLSQTKKEKNLSKSTPIEFMIV